MRRVAAALREMRWGQVVLELALLVTGILIALAVDGWIDDRRDARTERQYLELLLRDLDRDLQSLAEVIAFEEAQMSASILAYRALRLGVAPGDREAVAAALSQITARRTLRPARATYADLLGTGNLRLIRNVALRDRIVSLYEESDRAQLVRDRNNLVFVDQMYMQQLLDSGLVAPRPARNLPSLAASDQAFAERVGVAIDAEDDLLWQLPAGDPRRSALASRVWYRGLVSQVAVEQARQIAEETDSVRQAVAHELAARWPR